MAGTPTGLVIISPGAPETALYFIGASAVVNKVTNTYDITISLSSSNIPGLANLTVGGNPGPVPYVCAPGILCEDTVVGPYVDATNHRVGIGTSTPTVELDIEGSGPLVNIGGAGGSSVLNIINLTGTNPLELHTANAEGLTSYAHSNTSFRGSDFLLMRSRGTMAVPLAVQNGDALGYYQFGGYNGTTYTQASAIVSTATENWSGTANGSGLEIDVVTNGTTNQIAAITILNSGIVQIPVGLSFSVASSGITFKSGSNARTGTGTLSGGTLIIPNTSVTANSVIMVTGKGGGANIGALYVASQTAGVGFTVTSTNGSDTQSFAYWIFETN